MDKLKELCRQFIKFGFIGVLNTAIYFAIYYLFIFLNKDLYIVGNTVGFVVSVLNSYYFNNKYVFEKKQEGNARPLIKMFICYGFTFLISTALLWIFVNKFNISEKIAPIINLCFTIPLNFLLNKFWAFK